MEAPSYAILVSLEIMLDLFNFLSMLWFLQKDLCLEKSLLWENIGFLIAIRIQG